MCLSCSLPQPLAAAAASGPALAEGGAAAVAAYAAVASRSYQPQSIRAARPARLDVKAESGLRKEGWSVSLAGPQKRRRYLCRALITHHAHSTQYVLWCSSRIACWPS